MKRNHLHSKGLLVLTIPLLLLGWACMPKSGCAPAPKEPFPAKPNKPVIKYTLTRLERETSHKIPSPQIRSIVSSLNGEFVYVVGKEKAQLKSFDVEKNLWDGALGDFKGISNANDRKRVEDLSNVKVSGFSVTPNGILFTLTSDKGLVVLDGTGVSRASYYPQGPHTFPKGPMTPFFVATDNAYFIYLQSGEKAVHGVLFRNYVTPPNLDNNKPEWDNSIFKTLTPKQNLDHVFYARVEDQNKNLLLADITGIKRIKAGDVGKNNVALDNNGKAIYGPEHFMLDGKTKNDHINTMALVDKKYLVVGLKSTNPNNGGLAIADITEDSPTWHHFGAGEGLSVDSIAVEHMRNPELERISAVITTDRGFLMLGHKGQLVELIPKKGFLVTYKLINDNKAEIKDYDKAKSGFLCDYRIIDPKKDGYLGAAQDKNGLWYLAFNGSTADENGIFTLDIKIDQVESKRPLDIPRP